ncbi:MAG: translocation/assembly module TamB domain-containing protein [Desulfovibrionaceae bacterium]|nr:translocation/assembly module TamB domain-containing protein [Desulfovibrionaceae bacterium]
MANTEDNGKNNAPVQSGGSAPGSVRTELEKARDDIRKGASEEARKGVTSLVNKGLAQTGLGISVDKLPADREELKAEVRKQAEKGATNLLNKGLAQTGLGISVDKIPTSQEELKAEARKQAEKGAATLLNKGLAQTGLGISVDKIPTSQEELKAEARKQAAKGAATLLNKGLAQTGLGISVDKIPANREELAAAATKAAMPLLKKLRYKLLRTVCGIFGIHPPLPSQNALSRLAGAQAVQEMKNSFLKRLWGILRSRLPGGAGPQADLRTELAQLWRETRDSAKDKAENLKTSLWKRVARVASILVCGPVLVVLLVLGAAFGFLQTNFGQNFLQEKLNAVLEPSGIVISDLGGMIPISTRASITMKDADGTWLEARNCLVALDFGDIPNALGLTVRAESGHLWRIPAKSGDEPATEAVEEESSSIDVRLKLEVLTRVTNVIPPWVPGVALRNLEFASFQVERAVFDPAWTTLSEEERNDPAKAGALTVYFRGDAAIMPDTVERWMAPLTTGEMSLLVLPVPASVSSDIAAAAFNAEPFSARGELPVCEIVQGIGLDALTAGLSLSGTLKDPQLAVEARLGSLEASGRKLSQPLVFAAVPAGWMPNMLAGKPAAVHLGVFSQMDAVPVSVKLDAETTFDGLSPKIRLMPLMSGPGVHLQGDLTAVIPSSLMETAKSVLPGGGPEAGPFTVRVPLASLEGSLGLDIADFRLLPLAAPDMSGTGSLGVKLSMSRKDAVHAAEVTVQAKDLDLRRSNVQLAGLTSLDVKCALSELDFEAGINPLAVQASLDIQGQKLATGALDPFDVSLKTSASLSDVHLDLSAAGGITSTLQAALSRDAEARTVRLDLQGSDISAKKGGAELAGLKTLALVCDLAGLDLDACFAGGIFDATKAGSLDTLQADVQLKAGQVRTGAVAPISADIRAGGSFDSLQMDLSATGGVKALVRASGSARDRTASVSALNVSVPSHKCGIRLTSPASVRLSQESVLPVEVKGFNLQLEPGGRIEASGAYGPETLQAVLRVVNLDTRPWQKVAGSIPPALINVRAAISGSLQNPAGDLSVRVQDLVLPVDGLAPISTTVDTKLASSGEGARIDTKVSLDERTRRALGISRLDVQAGLLVPRKGTELNFAGIMEAPVQAKVSYRGTGSQLWALAGQPSRRFSGELSLDAEAAGTPARPSFDAAFRLAKGSFTDMEFGAQVRDITLNVNAACNGDLAATRVDLDLSLNDGRKNKGTVTASGTVHPVSMRNTSIRADIASFSPLRRRDLRAVLSGSVNVSGLLTAPSVTGRLSVDKGNVLLEELNLPASSVTTLDLVEGPRENVLALRARKNAPQEQTGIAVPGSLDMDVTIRKFFVDGYGLDTEWKADLKARGPLSNVGLLGKVEAVRGRLNILSRNFTMEEGVVSFAGGTEPFLNLKMTTQASEVEAAIVISGSLNRVKDLTPKLESDPSMPQDDILAYILFGKPANELSQFQMLQLAQNMAMLATFGTGSGTRSTVRQITGLDVVNLNQDSDGNASLEMGKYLFDSVYAGIEQGTDSNSETTAVVRWELGKRTSAEFETGGDTTSVGLKWKINY